MKKSDKIQLSILNFNRAGVAKFRVIDPHIHLQKLDSKFFISVLNHEDLKNEELFLTSDLVFAHSSCSQKDEIFNILKQYIKKGVKFIVDFDDYWNLPSVSPLYRKTLRDKYPQKAIEFAKIAAGVTTTTIVLAQELKRSGIKNIKIIPNSILQSESQFIPKPITSQKVRVGWIGGSSHLDDIKLLRGVDSVIRKNNAQFVLGGFNDQIIDINTNRHIRNAKKSVWSEFEKIVTGNYDLKDSKYVNYLKNFTKTKYPKEEDQLYRRIWTQPIQSYGEIYNNIDISLAPLVNNKFNNLKSQLKIVEAGFHKKALIASKVLPYTLDLKHGENALLVPESKNHKLWKKYIDLLINDEKLRDKLSNNLHEMVIDKFNLDDNTKSRIKFYKKIINNE